MIHYLHPVRLTRIVINLLMCAMALAQSSSNGEDKCHLNNENDIKAYVLTHSPVIEHFRFFTGPSATLSNAQLQVLTDFANGITGELHGLAASALVQRLQAMNGLPLAHIKERPFTVAVQNGSDVSAWACENQSAGTQKVVITSAFVYHAALISLKYALDIAKHPPEEGPDDSGISSLSFDDEFNNPDDIIQHVDKLRSERKDDEVNPSQSFLQSMLQYAERQALYEDLGNLETIATMHYAKLLAFVIGHEASHIWIDGCSLTTSELRADDYGFMLSSLLLDEQLIHAMLLNSKQLIGLALDRKFSAYRLFGVKEVRANKVSCRGRPEGTQACYCQWAALSNAQLRRKEASTKKAMRQAFMEALSEMPPEFRQPLSKRGFELFSAVYEDMGTKEYLAGDITHPPVSLRKNRLQGKYSQESFIVQKVYGALLNHSVAVPESTASKRNDYAVSLFWPALPKVCQSPKPKSISPQSDDPCLNPPPKLDEWDDE